MQLLTVGILLLAQPFLLPMDATQFLTELARILQKACSARVSETFSISHEFLNALVCGVSMPGSNEKNLIQNSGLIHLFVVSGSHFIFLKYLLEKANFSKLLQEVSMIFFLFFSGLQAPGTRHLVETGVRSFFSRHKMAIQSDVKIFISGVLCLSLFPPLVESLSLQLSWIACLALASPLPIPAKNKTQKLFLRMSLIFLLLYWPLSHFTDPSPLSVFSNFFLSSIVGLILFPCGLLAVAFPASSFVFDFLMNALLVILNLFFQSNIGEHEALRGKSWILDLWIYILILHLLIGVFRMHRSRMFLKAGK